MAISSRGAERTSSMQSLSAYMLIGLHFPIWIWTLLKWSCLLVHLCFALFHCFVFFSHTGTKNALRLAFTSLPGCTLGNGKSVDSQWFCYSFLCSCDTANIAVMSGSAAGRRAEHMISVCKYQIQKHMPKRLPSQKSEGGYTLAIRADCNYTL